MTRFRMSRIGTPDREIEIEPLIQPRQDPAPEPRPEPRVTPEEPVYVPAPEVDPSELTPA